MKTINYVLIGVVVIILFFIFLGGYKVGRNSVHCPEITHDTIYHTDTTTHHIYHIWPWYIQSEPSVVYYPVPQDIDTAEILKEYFSKHIYDRKWENDTLLVNVSDTISQNTPIGNGFTYKIKTPFTTVNNTIDKTVTYNRYFLLGFDLPITATEYYNIEGIYVAPRWYAGLGYEPKINSIRIKAGISVLQFKQRK